MTTGSPPLTPHLRVLTADKLVDGLKAFRLVASAGLAAPAVFFCLPESWLGTARDLEYWVECTVVDSFTHGLSVTVYSNSSVVADTVRSCVLEKRIGPDNVFIIDVVGETWHHMRVDAQGNLLRAPQHYRQWHHRATSRLLGFSDPEGREP